MTRQQYLKHKEIIEAWANGAEIEFKDSLDGWHLVDNPFWDLDSKYRVKHKLTYLELHKKCELKVGDKVRIVRTWDVEETDGKLSAPINIVNKIGVIKTKDHNSYEILLNEEFMTWFYPYFVLEKVVEEYIPFDFKDDLLGSKILSEDGNDKCIIVKQTKAGICTDDDFIKYRDLLEDWKFLDGSPCGKLKQ